MSRSPRRQKSRSVFYTIMLPLLLLILVEILLLVGGIRMSGVTARLDRNAEDILGQQVQNRRNYLEGQMVGNWSDLSMLSASINETANQMLRDGEISLSELDKGSDGCAPFLLAICDDLISTMYSKKVSGIFVILNTGELPASPEQPCPSKPGIYLRDLDPASAPSIRSADLLIERAPIEVVRSLGISTDARWRPLFLFGEEGAGDSYAPLFQPLRAAFAARSPGDPSDYGHWCFVSAPLQGDERGALTYSVPLVLEDGTIYGVLGVSLLEDYLKGMLPSAELYSNNQGAYLLATKERENLDFLPAVIDGAVLLQDGKPAKVQLHPQPSGGYRFTLGGREFYAALTDLPLYNSNAPFEEERWGLIGAVECDKLYAFSGQVWRTFLAIAMLTLLAGIFGSLLVSRRLSNPIRRLAEEVDRVRPGARDLPRLSATGITEIDRFSQAIAELSRDVLDSSTKFLRIMEMASVDLAGFELKEGDSAPYGTDNYFPLLGREGVDLAHLDCGAFQSLMEQLYRELSPVRNEDGSYLYRIPLPQGGIRYVRMEGTKDGGRYIGLAEDVTATTLERLRIEHERDYDLLTGLYNRRAFYRTLEKLFREPSALGHAALLMLDLDNLKSTNDRFGHDWGDQYIRQAGQCFAGAVPGNSLVARVSGDEFLLFLHGYRSREEIRAILSSLTQAIHSSVFSLPDGETVRISASGGVAWYPDDSKSFDELVRYADFAMYQIKRSRKGELGDFDLGVYNHESFLIQSRREFLELLQKELLTYHFQPIVDAVTGRPVAFEALMRVDMPTLRSPDAVLQLARREGRLRDIERLTWFTACGAYQALLDRSLVPEDAFLFINSIASQQLTYQECLDLKQRYGGLLPRTVIEITEDEDMDPAATRAKREAPSSSGIFALDDYGSGYNSEKNLLERAPRFIKVDISIIRGIDTDPDKQQIVLNITRYAHERGMKIIAEGLESASEVSCVLRLGVDLLQGYYLARPAAVPSRINQPALDLIREFRQGGVR